MSKNKVTEIRLIEDQENECFHVVCTALDVAYAVETLENAGRDIVDLIGQHPECRFEIKMERPNA